jgi:hypothetical protein
MASVYSIAFSVVGIIAIHSCLLVWTALLLPRPVERARQRLESRPVTSLLMGLFSCLLTIGLVSAFLLFRPQSVRGVAELLEFLADNLHITRFYNDDWIITNLFVWLLAAPMMAGAIVGGAGFARLFAARAGALMRKDRPLLGLACGALCTSASYFMPIVGWFVFLPLVGLMSVGAGVGGMWGGRATRAVDSLPTTSGRPNPQLSRL